MAMVAVAGPHWTSSPFEWISYGCLLKLSGLGNEYSKSWGKKSRGRDLLLKSEATMAIDAVEASSPSQSLPNFGQQRHFYVAVDRLQFKMETLVDLMGVVGRRPFLPMIVCCSSRDELDAVCSAVSKLPYISLATLYSDLAETERAEIFEKFRHAITKWNQSVSSSKEGESEFKKHEEKSHMLVVSDACLPLLSSGESPFSSRVLINYELPSKKETYLRRTTTCLAADGIAINMVVGGEVVNLKAVEEGCGLVIAEMPINISEIL